MEYTGYKELTLSDEQFSQLYSEGKIDGIDFLENEYAILRNANGEIVDKIVCKDGKLAQIRFATFKNSYTGSLKPRNEH